MHNHAVGCMFMLERVFVHKRTSDAVGLSADSPHLGYRRGADRPLESKSLCVVGFATVCGWFLTECSGLLGARVCARSRARARSSVQVRLCVCACARARHARSRARLGSVT